MKFSSASGAVVASVEKLVTCEVSLLSVDDAARELRRISRACNQLESVKAELAAHAVRGDARNGASWLAGETGVSERDARKLLDVQGKLSELPDVADAARRGDISRAKAEAIANGADGDKSTADDLLDDATKKSVEEIRELARYHARRKAGSETEHNRRLRAKRSCTSWKDDDGLICTLIKNAPCDAAWYQARLRELERTIPREPGLSAAAHRCDAFMKMLSGGNQTTTVVAHVDYDALRRGWTEGGETSEVAGLGHLPVGHIQQMLNDCVLRVVVTKHNRLVWYGGSNDLLPERIKEAVRAKFKDRCARCGEYGQQVDHIVARFNGGSNDIDNLQCLCDPCHARKTTHDAPFTKTKYYGTDPPRAG